MAPQTTEEFVEMLKSLSRDEIIAGLERIHNNLSEIEDDENKPEAKRTEADRVLNMLDETFARIQLGSRSKLLGKNV